MLNVTCMKKNLNFTCKTKHTLLCETFRSLYFESNIHFHAKKKLVTSPQSYCGGPRWKNGDKNSFS